MFHIISVIIALVLYYESPNDYSYSYCFLLHNLFLLYVVYLQIRDKGKEVIGYNTLFTISYYFTNFVYPIFIYPIDPEFSLFKFDFNHDVITKATALALVAYTCYGLGYSRVKNLYTSKFKLTQNASIFPSKVSNNWRKLIVVAFIIFYLFGGFDMFEHTYQVSVSKAGLIPRLMNIILFPLTIFSTIFILYDKSYVRQNKWYFVFGIVSLALMTTGTRTLPLMLMSVVFYIFCNTRKISRVSIFVILLMGVFLMSFVGQVRSSGILDAREFNIFEQSSVGYIEKMADLIINNRNLYVFYDYVQEHGINYGLTMLSTILSPIPFLQSVFVRITGIPDVLLNSATFSTFLTLGSRPSLGLGTNLVGDVYLSFGLLGVVVLFYFLGYFVNNIRQKAYAGSLYSTIAYFVMIADCIYSCRSAYLGNLRILVWGLFICWIVLKIYPKNYFNKNEYSNNNCEQSGNNS
ncbi:MAG: oligosaccharide repeat unit polymerase [Bacteroidales bacterium]|nr:oligosaccharide repeat unit polymerase [Bacteroidales bacterium]